MKKNIFLWMLFAFGAVTFTACSEDDDNGGNGGNGNVQNSCYVVNQGGWGFNNASLQVYDAVAGTASSPDCNEDIFFAANGELLGDVAQDLLWVGDRLFVTVTNSQKLEILDETGKRVRQYTYAAEGASPRYMATDGQKVYVTNYDGYVYVYNAASGDSLTRIYSGSYPEGISVVDGTLVVNNSNHGGYGGGEATVAVIDLASGEAKIIKENVCNPYTQSVVCGGEVYIIDSGNYSEILPTIYRVDTENATLEKIVENATYMATYGECIYYVNASFSYSNYMTNYSALCKLDVATGEKSEILPEEAMKDVCSLNVNPRTGDVYVGFSPSADDFGTMRVYGADGEQKGLFDVGYYTSGARFRN
ncbi:MAG: hypothetical protein II296_08905 [Bacteroidaceae bacterium]|nr:hypothetical protein [Bacteroidaceae bacterium]